MSCPVVVDVLVPSGPVVVEVITPGPPGPIGSRWITGSDVPGSGVGAVGDFYLRENGDVYGPKASGGWGSIQFTLTGTGTGTGAPALARRIDASASTTIYVGRAAAGTAESATGWTVIRTTYSALGVLQTTATASGAWTARASLTYS
jgi:hypothetical protein